MATNTIPVDKETAQLVLEEVGICLAKAVGAARTTGAALRDAIVRIRPLGLLTVDQMAEAIVRDRNHIDAVWSAYGDTTKGKQTRVAVVADPDGPLPAEYGELYGLARDHRNTSLAVTLLRSERDQAVAAVYASKVLGPSAIAAHVGIDRNHVLRISRKAGVAPQHRTRTRNQHSK